MPKFTWEAKTKAGAQQKGVMEATNESMVEAQLKKYGFTGITVKAEKAGFKFGWRRRQSRYQGSCCFYQAVCNDD